MTQSALRHSNSHKPLNALAARSESASPCLLLNTRNPIMYVFTIAAIASERHNFGHSVLSIPVLLHGLTPVTESLPECAAT